MLNGYRASVAPETVFDTLLTVTLAVIRSAGPAEILFDVEHPEIAVRFPFQLVAVGHLIMYRCIFQSFVCVGCLVFVTVRVGTYDRVELGGMAIG